MYQNQFQRPAQYSGATVQQMPMTQALSKEEIEKLRNKGGQFNIRLTAEEVLIGACTHKDLQGNFTITEMRDGQVACSICGQQFNLIQTTQDEVANAVNLVKDVLQTIKTYYVDIPVETAREFFVVLPMLDRVPQLYTMAMERFQRYERANGMAYGGQANGFAMLNNLFQPAMGGMGMVNPAAAMMGGFPQQQQGMYQQQPYQQQGAYQQPAYNPFDQGYMNAPQQQPQFQQQQQQQFQQQQPQMVETTVQQPGPAPVNVPGAPVTNAKFEI